MSTATTVRGNFIHVVASVELKAKTGKIHNVNPSTVGITGTGDSHGVALVLRDAQSNELYRVQPDVRLPSCPSAGTRSALIQQDLPAHACRRSRRQPIPRHVISNSEGHPQ